MAGLENTATAISAMPDNELLDRYINLSLQAADPDPIDRLLIGLIKSEWNKRHPEDPMPPGLSQSQRPA